MATSTNRKIGLVDDHSAGKPSLGASLELVLSQMGGLIDNVLDGLLLSAGLHPHKKPQGGQLRPELVPVVERLLENRESLRTAFAGQMRILAYGGVSDTPDRPLVRFEDIQLLDMQQLDESIELARVQHEIMVVVEPVLPRIHALMSSLMGWITVQPSINPLRPESFAKALRDTLAVYVAVPAYRSELLAAAAGRMGVALRQIYRELSEWLLSMGVEPAGQLVAPAAPSDSGKENPRSSEAARTLLTLERLRRLFSLDAGVEGLGEGGVDFLHTVPASVQALQDTRQVEAMIQRLERRRRQRASRSGQAATANVDLMQRGPLDGRRLGEQIGAEVTRMMLDNIALDERLLPRVREQIERLGPGLLDISRADPRFFSDNRHPARLFLESVTDRSLAFTSEMEDGYERFLAGVTRSIDFIAGSLTDKVALFTRELERLQGIWQKEDRAQVAMREETARALLHIEQRNLLAERLVQGWQPRLADPGVPPAVRDFIAGPWAQAVAESQLNPSRGVSDPHRYEALVDDLIWSVQPQLAWRNPKRLVQLIPGLLASLRAGLQLIAFPPDLITRFFDQLIGWHELALQESRPLREKAQQLAAGGTAEGVAEGEAGAPVSEREALDEAFASTTQGGEAGDSQGSSFSQVPWLAEGETQDAGYLEADSVMPVDVATVEGQAGGDAAGLHPDSPALADGTWVELMLDGRWTRLQLTWSSPHRTLFMFTSNRGRAHSMSRRTMNRLLAGGMIRIVSRGQILDQALDHVAQQALLNSIGRLPEPN